ncbi:MAG: hypothetical protein WBP54_03060 [Pelodictyon phaeoclathratiforme]
MTEKRAVTPGVTHSALPGFSHRALSPVIETDLHTHPGVTF